MSTSISGGCLCKAVRFELTGEPQFSIQCYCEDCQHISGGGHLPQLVVNRDNVTMSGPLKIYQWKSDLGNDLELGFCSDCSSPIYKTTTLMKDKMSILVGALCDSSNYSIGSFAYRENRQPWDES